MQRGRGHPGDGTGRRRARRPSSAPSDPAFSPPFLTRGWRAREAGSPNAHHRRALRRVTRARERKERGRGRPIDGGPQPLQLSPLGRHISARWREGRASHGGGAGLDAHTVRVCVGGHIQTHLESDGARRENGGLLPQHLVFFLTLSALRAPSRSASNGRRRPGRPPHHGGRPGRRRPGVPGRVHPRQCRLPGPAGGGRVAERGT